MSNLSPSLIASLRHTVKSKRILADTEHGYCYACGAESDFAYAEIISDDLARQWGISDEDRHAYSSRESRQCTACGATHRNRQMARLFCELYGKKSGIKSLKELVEDPAFRELRFAEINFCGGLHQFFIRQGNMVFSEFEPQDKNIPHQDLHNLTYETASFDIVATSDTLEHIPDYERALDEIHRILKPGGRHIFTIPLIWRDKTRSRAEFTGPRKKKIKYLIEPAYHGPPLDENLVWTDFGGDILKVLNAKGFKTRVYYYNLLNRYDVGCVFESTKLK